jgi:SAM-dependent methyltransferase
MQNLITWDVKKVTECRACKGTKFRKYLDLGEQPLANQLLPREQVEYLAVNNYKQATYPLALMICQKCDLVQLTHIVNPALMFNDYLYHSSTSAVFQEHFEKLAEREIGEGSIKPGELVVDIGSNDGILLKPFQSRGANVLGVDPAVDIALQANKAGIKTIAGYFTRKLANEILEKHGPAKLITATNVFAHADDLDEILDGVKILLADDGRFMIEVTYMPKMIKQGTFDLIYHEHLCYWHLWPLAILLNRKGFMPIQIEHVDTHGGSIRVFAVQSALASGPAKWDGDYNNFTKSKEFWAFPKKIENTKKQIVRMLTKYRKQGKTIVGYGAPAKMSTMTNYFGIGPETISFIVEDAPAKWDRYSPGKFIRIGNYEQNIKSGYPDFIFIFAWNFAESIMMKCRAAGYKGSFIVPFPTPKII